MINKLRARIDSLITKQLFEEQNCFIILNNRDNEVFDSKWIYTYNAVENKKSINIFRMKTIVSLMRLGKKCLDVYD